MSDLSLEEMRALHLEMAIDLQRGQDEAWVKRFYTQYMTPEFHREAADDYTRWIDEKRELLRAIDKIASLAEDVYAKQRR